MTQIYVVRDLQKRYYLKTYAIISLNDSLLQIIVHIFLQIFLASFNIKNICDFFSQNVLDHSEYIHMHIEQY